MLKVNHSVLYILFFFFFLPSKADYSTKNVFKKLQVRLVCHHTRYSVPPIIEQLSINQQYGQQ